MAWLLLLLATLVAAAWAIHGLDVTGSPQSPAVAELEDGGQVCRYTPGNLFGPPTPAEAAEARAAWFDWSQICRYDPSRGFGAWPTDAELEATRTALAPWGTMDRGLAALWTLFASLGLAATGHGLLVGSLSIFNPSFIAIGWWLLLPDFLLAQGGWLGAASLGVAAAGGLGPRYIRRREVLDALGRMPRTWLTPKRLILAGGGWLAAVGVLAAVYPNIAKLIPRANPIAAERSMPRIGSPSTVSGNRAAGGEQIAGGAVIDPVIAPPSPFTPPANGSGQNGNPSDAQQQTAQNDLAAAFTPTTMTGSGSGGGNGGSGGNGGGSDGASSGAPAPGEIVSQPIAGALQTIASYFPPAPVTPSPGPGSTTPAPDESPAPSPSAPDESAQQPADPAPGPGGNPPVTPAPGTEGSQAIGETPIITPDYPLPAAPGTLLPESPPAATPDDPRGEPGTTPDPGTPKTDDVEETPPVLPVPEPATLGLFALGVGALTLRRKGRNKR